MSRASSFAPAYRSSGRAAIAFRQTASSGRGTSRRTRRGAANRPSRACPSAEGPSYGAPPVRSAYSVAPRLNTSLAGPTRSVSPRACSGHMYAGVPFTAPGIEAAPPVPAASGPATGSVAASGSGTPTRFASPQSTRSVSPYGPSMTLPGLMSR